MDTHVKVLAVLYILMGALGLCLALLVFFALGTVAGIVGISAPPEDAAIAVPLLGLGATALGVFFLLLSLPLLIAGWGLIKLQPWARVLGIVLAAINLINFSIFPVSTAIGIYGLWVLLTKETERLFAAPRPTEIRQ